MTWNLRSATDRKWAHLEALEPDVAVVCEAARRPRALDQPALGRPDLSWEWEGTNVHKGLGVAAFGRPLRRLVTQTALGRWSIGVAAADVAVIGIWSCPRRSGAYADEVGRGLDAFEPLLERHPSSIVAGDFNVSGSGRGFGRLCARLTRLGLVSAYHHWSGEPFGHEQALTIHPRHGGERGYHIDYCFLSRDLVDAVRHVELGSHERWVASGLSDHVPLIVDLDL